MFQITYLYHKAQYRKENMSKLSNVSKLSNLSKVFTSMRKFSMAPSFLLKCTSSTSEPNFVPVPEIAW